MDFLNVKVHSWNTLERDNRFFIYVSGRTKESKSVSIRIDDFKPFIYIETSYSVQNKASARKLFARIVTQMKPETCPVSWRFSVKKKLYGNKPTHYLMLTFRTPSHQKKFEREIAPRMKLQLHEHDIEPIIKYTAMRKLDMSGWMRIQPYNPPEADDKFSSADIDRYVQWDKVCKADVDDTILVKNLIASFDIEVSSVNHNSKSPDATKSLNRCFQVAVTFARNGDKKEDFEPYLLTMYDCPDLKEEYPNSTVLNYETEAELLVGFSKLIKKKDPDILVGWNTHKFDWEYMRVRAEMLGVFNRWLMMSRFDDFECEIYETKWSSSAYKNQIMKIPAIPGRLCLDLQIDVERNYKFDTYSLNNVAKQQLNLEKEDITHKQLFKLVDIAKKTLPAVRKKNITNKDVQICKDIVESYINDEETTDETGATNVLYRFRKSVRKMTESTLKDVLSKAIRNIGVYCVWDTYLPLLIMQGLETLEGLRQMSNITCVPMWYLQVRGQQIKVLAQVYRRTLWGNYVIPYRNKDDEDNRKYQGATVFNAKPGAKKNVGTLDFASLYPSIMIALNICWTTLVEDDSIADEECQIVEWDSHIACDHDSNKEENFKKAKAQAKRKADEGEEPDVEAMILCGHYKYKWRKIIYNSDGSVRERGILPQLLQDLLSERRAVKKKIAKHSLTMKMHEGRAKQGDIEYAKKIGLEVIEPGSLSSVEVQKMKLQLVVWDKYQLALKISANSSYGGLGAKTSKLYLMEGAACITARGRQLIEETARYTTDKWDCELVYGDSVTGDTPVFVKKKDGEFDVVMISDCGERWKVDPNGKEYSCVRQDIESVWTEDGWTHIENVMRHKTKKKIFRVLTHVGCVDVTEDHSLLTLNGEKIKPAEVKQGTELLHTDDFPVNNIGSYIDEDKAFVYGLFMGDGSCEDYNCPSGRKQSWAIIENNLELLTKTRQKIGEDKCKILDVKKSSKVYKLVAIGDVKAFVDEYLPIFYDGKYKIVPQVILNSPVNIKKAFLEGYYAGDGNKTGSERRCDIKGKIGAMGLFYLIRSIGYHVSINARKDNIYRMTFSKNTPGRNVNAIKKIYELGCVEDYVYDFTTSNHHFHAGVGSMIVSNTDSVMLSFTNADLKESFKLCEECSEKTTHHLKCWVIGVDDDYKLEGEDLFMYNDLPIDLEFENMYGNFIIFTKKRYLATIVDKEGNVLAEQKKGVCTARRDNSHFLRNIYRKCARMALDDCPKKEVYNMICDEVLKLFTRQILPRELVIYKSIQDIDSYKEGVKQPHLLLARRMKLRGDEVAPNTRMEYLVLWTPNEDKKTVLQGDKVEDYTYYRENYRTKELLIDNIFYVSQQLRIPIQQLLDTKYPGEKVPYENLEAALFGEIDNIPITIQKTLHAIPIERDRIKTLKESCEEKADKVKDNKKYLKMIDLCEKYQTSETKQDKDKIITQIFGHLYKIKGEHKMVLRRLKTSEKVDYIVNHSIDVDPQIKKYCERWRERRFMKRLCEKYKTQYKLPHKVSTKKKFIIKEEHFMKNLALAHERHRDMICHFKRLTSPFILQDD